MRAPRIVRVGLVQNSIALPTSAPFPDQKKAIMQKVKPMIDAAGASGVNILCLQVSSKATTLFGSHTSGSSQITWLSWVLESGSMDDAICILHPGEEMVRICRAR